MKQTLTKQCEPSLPELVHPQQEAQIHPGTPRSWWHHPWMGYLFSLPLLGLALLVVFLGQRWLPHFSFFDIPFFLAVIVVALSWGAGPALFTVVLSALVLDYFALPPLGTLDIHTRMGLSQLLPFVVAAMMIALITTRREAARRHALLAEQEVQVHADELEQANQLKDQFLSVASHELKTPITIIRSYTQLLLIRLSKRSELSSAQGALRPTLEKIVEQTGRLNACVDDLLDLSRIRAGKMELRRARCELGEVCRAVVEDQRQLSGRPIELVIPPVALMLEADRDRMSQVVINLVSNAVKYSPEGCPVEVHLSQRGETATIQVCDAGPGIPVSQRKRIFEAFYRTPEAQGSSRPGLGLGLAICREIIERHGGRIWCDSCEGKGSRFTVELPVH
jgi:signal transduction histidine kinase